VNISISIEPSKDVTIPVYVHYTDKVYSWEQRKTDYYYKQLMEEVATPPTSEQYWSRITNLRLVEDFLYKSYMSKIKQIQDKKLAETNFKILNNILPCNRNLFKWGKRDTNLCYLCEDEETISHLLFHCKHARPIWEIASNALLFEKALSHNMVIFGIELDMVLNHIISILVYFIYREWLICSFENKQRKEHLCLHSLMNYLNIRKNVYLKCAHPIWIDVCIKLDILMAHLESYV